MVTYYESAVDIVISRARAVHEVIDHGATLDEFYQDMGFHDKYVATEVLEWLGY